MRQVLRRNTRTAVQPMAGWPTASSTGWLDQLSSRALGFSSFSSRQSGIAATGGTSPVPRNLSCLQAGRGIAAILVVLYHNSVAIFVLPKYWGEKPFGRLFDFGDSGVFFFFVLSGFIILHAHYHDLDRPDRVRYYTIRRFRRIYPVYWASLFVVLPFYFFMNFGKGFETQPQVILSSFLLLHFDSFHTVSAVSWTLFHEILFYALFALVIWNLRIGSWILVAWLMLSVASMATNQAPLLTGFYLSYVHLLFGFGMAAAWWVRRRSVPVPMATALVGAAVFLLSGADEAFFKRMPTDCRTLAYGLGATFLVTGLVELELRGNLKIPAWLGMLGDSSYSIYLFHFYVLSLLAKMAWASGAAVLLPPTAAYALLACLAVTAGVVCHRWVERPLLGLFARRAVPRRVRTEAI